MAFDRLFKKCILVIFASFLSLLCGCYIPLDNERIGTQEVLGERKDEQGKIVEEVLKTYIHNSIFVILGPDGQGETGTMETKYRLRKGEIIKKLPHIDSFISRNKYQIKKPILPVGNSEKWVAIAPHEIKSWYTADICVIVFDENILYKELIIPDCTRIKAGSRDEEYDIEFEDDNTIAIIHTQNGDYLLNVTDDTFEKI
ncbi:MAG: hypothetical protein KAS96_02880 [Planctomycetes bacterium]|nr:hypothetical protein [Planctomycetota bacterium]